MYFSQHLDKPVDAQQPIKLLQLTDTHLGHEPGDALLGVNTDHSLIDVLEHVNVHHPDADFMTVTGDVANHGHVAAYHRFIEITGQYWAGPLAWLPGNHDCPLDMAQTQALHCSQSELPEMLDLGPWVVLMLDSSVRGSAGGDFSEAELARLKTLLYEYRERHILVMLHHQPVRVGSAWIDQYVVKSSDAFWALLEAAPQVKGVAWGHVHQDYYAQRGSIELWGTPSTCVQFKPTCDDFTLDALMPGYRYFELYSDGRIVSAVERLSHKDYGIDFSSLGY